MSRTCCVFSICCSTSVRTCVECSVQGITKLAMNLLRISCFCYVTRSCMEKNVYISLTPHFIKSCRHPIEYSTFSEEVKRQFQTNSRTDINVEGTDCFVSFQSEPIRVLVTGAAGQIAYSLLFGIAKGCVFGKDQVKKGSLSLCLSRSQTIPHESVQGQHRKTYKGTQNKLLWK